MNRRKLNTSQTCTGGQVKIEPSLNSIYNRVTLLKSKNISRKLIGKTSSSNKSNNLQENYFNLNILPTTNNPSQEQSLLNSRASIKYVPSVNHLNKLLEAQQTDNVTTNFWPSQPLIQINDPGVQQNTRPKSSSKFTLTHHSKPQPNRVYKTITGQRNHSNRVFLLSDPRLRSISKFSVNDLSKPGDKSSLSRYNEEQRKRPLTSSLGKTRDQSRFRVSEASKQKEQAKTQLGSTLELPRSRSGSKNKLMRNQKLGGSRTSLSLVRGEDRVAVFKKQIQIFERLYEYLSGVLGAIKQGLFEVQKAVAKYAGFIQQKNVSFIDDFMQGRQVKLQKLVRATRVNEALSICYLFLQIGTQKMHDNQSYLVNFIGHSLSNLLLVIRLYIIKQGKSDFEHNQFEKTLDLMQISSFGAKLTSTDDILLRIQHNNEIITMIYKRLGRHNEKFEACIQNFFKTAQRKKYSCSLCAHYIFEYLAMHIHELDLLDISPTLQLAPTPYVPPQQQKQYTLVIEPLGILQKNGKLRPYLNQFIKWAYKNFEVVLWTWQMPTAESIQAVYKQIAPYLTSALYRHHCISVLFSHYIDLSRLGNKRNIDNILIVDFDKRIFPHHQDNGIQCRWKGQSNDKNLLLLCQVLEQMISSKTNVPDTLRFYAEQIHSIRGY